jgi:hypothetical protein
MSATPQQVQSEINDNLAFFLKQLPKLLKDRGGQYALLRKCKIVDYFASAEAAQTEGGKRFSDGLFSVQKVVEVQVDLGFFSHAVHLG